MPEPVQGKESSEEQKFLPVETQEEAARRVIEEAQKVLGVEADPAEKTNTYRVDIKTTQPLRAALTRVQLENADIDDKFDPWVMSGNEDAVRFLDKLVKKRAEELHIPQDIPLDDVKAVKAYAAQQTDPVVKENVESLADKIALLNLISLMNDGALPLSYVPDGTSRGFAFALSRTADAPWNGPNAPQDPDRFFSDAFRQKLDNTSYYNSLTGADMLIDATDAQKERIINAALAGGFFQVKQGETPEQSFMNSTFCRQDVGRIAAEIMIEQAACKGISKHEIGEAIVRGDYVPHIDDLALVEDGLGKPTVEDNADMKARHDHLIYNVGVTEDDLRSNDYYYAAVIENFRNKAFQEEFGGTYFSGYSERLSPLAYYRVNQKEYAQHRDAYVVLGGAGGEACAPARPSHDPAGFAPPTADQMINDGACNANDAARGACQNSFAGSAAREPSAVDRAVANSQGATGQTGSEPPPACPPLGMPNPGPCVAAPAGR
ncbi:MAG: hypothetical protein KDI13_04945 [Alphaproteobacteria bacterium]|nr:hypothetical protein [Alphaproteobacteria bacterium]